MGPRMFIRGNALDRDGRLPPRVASMGPRMFIRGNEDVLDRHAQPRAASMGPRMFIRGNLTNMQRNVKGGLALQWGRGCSSAETSGHDARQIRPR